MQNTDSGPADAGPRDGHIVRAKTIEIGDSDQVTIERLSARKASRAYAILRGLSDKVPDLTSAWANNRAEYNKKHFIELDRAQAMLRYPPSVKVGDDGQPERYPDWVGEGEQRVPHPRAGEIVMIPSALDSISEQAWAEAGHKVRLPEDPSTGEQIAAIFDQALEVGEDHVYRLLALFTMSNQDVTAAWKAGDLNDRLQQRVDWLLDTAYVDQLMELAVSCGELVDAQFMGKVRSLGDRAGKALRLVGLDLDKLKAQTPPSQPQTHPTGTPETPETAAETSPEAKTPPPSPSTPTSSTDTPPSTPDGTSTPSSTAHGISSKPSETESSVTAP